MLANFRESINQVDTDMKAIQFDDIKRLKFKWESKIRTDFFKVRVAAMEIEMKANAIFEEAVHVLREANSTK